MLVRPIYVSTHLAIIKLQVWQTTLWNIQLPHLPHLHISASGTCKASTIFFTPTQPHEVHWYAEKPSGVSIWSSHRNSVSRLQPLHLKRGWSMIISYCLQWHWVQTRKLPLCISLSSLHAIHLSVLTFRLSLSSSKRNVKPDPLIISKYPIIHPLCHLLHRMESSTCHCP